MHSGIPIVRFTTILLLPITLVIVVLTVVSVVSSVRQADEDIERRLETVVEAVALAGVVDSLEWSTRLEELAQRKEYDRIWLIGDNHQINASSRFSEVGSTLEERWQLLLPGQEETIVSEEVPWGQRSVLFSAVWSDRDNIWAAVVFDNADAKSALYGRIARIIITYYLIWMVLAAIVYFLLRRYVANPLGSVENATKRLLEGEEIQEAKFRRLVLDSGVAVEGIVANITELMRNQQTVERRFKDMTALYASLFDLMPDMVLVVSIDGILLEANQSFCNILGFSQPDIRGTNVKTLSAQMPAEALIAFGSRCRDQNCKIENLDFLFRSVDGTDVPAHVTVQGVDYHGGPAFFVIASDRRDVQKLYKQLAAYNDTMELMVEERIEQTKQSAEYWNTLTGQDGVLLAGFDQDGKTVQWNENISLSTGFTIEEVPDVSQFVKHLIPGSKYQESFYNWMMRKDYKSLVCKVNTRTEDVLQIAWSKIDLGPTQQGIVHVLMGHEQDTIQE